MKRRQARDRLEKQATDLQNRAIDQLLQLLVIEVVPHHGLQYLELYGSKQPVVRQGDADLDYLMHALDVRVVIQPL